MREESVTATNTNRRSVFLFAAVCAIMLAVSLSFVILFPGQTDAYAAGGVWAGSGTSTDPYLISDAADLAKLSADVDSGNAYTGNFFKLTADIDLGVAPYNTGSGWSPIGNDTGIRFSGTFDGNHKVIRNLYVKNSNDAGLFDGLDASGTIKNLGIESGTVIGSWAAGIVAGYSYGKIIDCYNKAGIAGSTYVGGIVSCVSGSSASVTGCYNEGIINGSQNYVGGIAGMNYSAIQNCYNTGKVIGRARGMAGGIAGCLSTSGKVISCYNTAEIEGAVFIGGIAGEAISISLIDDCKNYGNIIGGEYVGGIAGALGNQNADTATIQNSTNTGEISAEYLSVGLIAGRSLPNTNIINCVSGGSVKKLPSHFDDIAQQLDAIVWQGGGTGTDPYRITNAWELAKLSKEVWYGNDFSNKFFKLFADIDLNISPFNQGFGWTPIGNMPYYYYALSNDVHYKFFDGNFDGNGHVVKNLLIKADRLESSYYYIYFYNAGLFGLTGNNAVIRNLGIESGSITDSGYSMTGAIVGYNNGQIINCFNKANIFTDGGWEVGGIVGQNDGDGAGLIQNCYNAGKITAVGSSGYIGGIAGENYGASITDCYNTGTITAVGEGIGGIAGYNDAPILRCYNSAKIVVSTADYDYDENVGGIAGENCADIIDSYNTGDITAPVHDSVGGIAGIVWISRGRTTVISNCYNTGSIAAKNRVGGILGYCDGTNINADFEIIGCYNRGTISGAEDVGGIVGNIYADNLNNSEPCGSASVKQSQNYAKVSGQTRVGGIAGTLGNPTKDGYSEIRSCRNEAEVTGTTDIKGIAGRVYSPAQIIDSIEAFWEGKGTEAEPYLIKTAQDLARLAQGVNDGTPYTGMYFKMTADIDLSVSPYNTGGGWTPIGNAARAFNGIFDGGGKVIKNLWINRPEELYNGVFGRTGEDATVRNIGVQSGSVTGLDYTSGLIGSNRGQIFNCYNRADVSGADYVGGITGLSYSQTRASGIAIKDSQNYGKISGETYTGGIAGRVGSSTYLFPDTIQNCRNEGEITGKLAGETGYIGGVAGYAHQNSKITGCINTGKVTSLSERTGGIAGQTQGEILDSLNSGAISGVYYTGGITGVVGQYGTARRCVNQGAVTSSSGSVGGIAGSNFKTISDCSNAGSVQGTSRVGGITGYSGTVFSGETLVGNLASISNCYNTGSIKGTQGNSGGLVGTNHGPISDSYNTGTVQGTTEIGGIAGYNGASSVDGAPLDRAAVISRCFNTGDITASDTKAGGIAGINFHTVTESYNSGAVKGTHLVGGIAGYSGIVYVGGTPFNQNAVVSVCYTVGTVIATSLTPSVGGVVGGNNGGEIKNCYGAGSVVSPSELYAGGITGENYGGGSVTNCYYNKEESLFGGIQNADATGKAEGLTLAQMTTAMTGFTSGAWTKRSNAGDELYYPELVIFSGSVDSVKKAASLASVKITRITVTLTSVSAAGIIYGQSLSDSTISYNSGGVAGTFVWNTPGVIPAVTNAGFSATFTPSSIKYKPVTLTVQIAVQKATPTVTVDPYTETLYTDSALPVITGTYSVPGSLRLDAGQTLAVGTKLYNWTFTPSDTANYNIVKGTISLTAERVPAVITVADKTITYDGQVHSVAATSNSGGQISYWYQDSLFTGAINAGVYLITVKVAATANFGESETTVTLTILKAEAVIAAADLTVTFNGQPHYITGLAAGGGAVTYLNNGHTNAGMYTVTVQAAESQNYKAGTKQVTLKIERATPVVTVSYTGGTLTYGDALPALSFHSNGVAGTCILNAGQTLKGGSLSYNWTFTPSDAANYTVKMGTITLTVAKKTPSVTAAYTGSQLYTISPLPAITVAAAETAGSISLNAGQSLIAGTNDYAFTFTPNDRQNFEIVTGFISLTVLKSTASITAADLTVAYNGLTHRITATTDGDGTISYTVEGLPFNGAINAGVYEITITVSETANYYQNSAVFTLTINKAAPVITASDLTVTYNGLPHNITATVDSGGLISYQNNNQMNAGTYSVIISAAETQNYLSGSRTVTLRIEKAVVTVTADFYTGELTYGDALPVITASAAPIPGSIELTAGQVLTAGTKEYHFVFTPDDLNNYEVVTGKISLTVLKATPTVAVQPYTATLTYGDPLPTLTIQSSSVPGVLKLDAGQTLRRGDFYYNWTFTPTDKTNNNTVTGIILLTVLKAAAVITVSDLTVTYNGAVHKINATTNGNGTIEYQVDDIPFTGAVNAGTYTVVITMAETDEYYAASKTVTLTILKAVGVITASNKTVVYDGSLVVISATVNSNAPLTYTSGGSPFTGFTNAGSYTVLITAPETQNYTSATQSVTLTIQQAASVINAYDKTVTYDGSVHSITALFTGDGILSYTNNDQTDAGVYTVTIHVTAGVNYKAASRSVVLTIKKATHSVTASPYTDTLRYGDSLPVIATSNTEGTIRLNAGQTLEVGTNLYEWTFTPTDTKNYNTVTGSISLTVLKGIAVITASDKTVTYNGAAQSISALKSGDGTLSYENNSHINAGVYTVTIRTSETANYLAASLTVKLTVLKAAGEIYVTNIEAVYDGKEYSVSASANSTGEISYDNNGHTDAGMYTVRIYLAEDQNHTSAYAEALIIINKAAAGISGANATFTFSGEPHYITASCRSDGEIVYHNNGKIDAGTYYVTVNVAETQNYLAASAVFTLTILKANLKINVWTEADELTYGDDLPALYCDNEFGFLSYNEGQMLLGGTNEYAWTFIPYNSANFHEVYGTIILWAQKAERVLTEEIVMSITIESVKARSITVVYIAGAEYSLDGVNWQKSNVFKKLAPQTEYTVFVRYSEDGNYFASTSITLSLQTEKGFTAEIFFIILLSLVVGAMIIGYGILLFSKKHDTKEIAKIYQESKK